MGYIRAVCISEKKGTGKKNVGEAVFIEDEGLKGDAHAGKWHRQVSLLSKEAVEAFKKRGASVEDGDFGENLLVEGFELKNLPVGTIFSCNGVVLELTQIGKECHSHCAIHEAVGDCIMPREGVFAKVLKGGTIHVGDEIRIIGETHRYRVGVLTVSDRSARGEREDLAGPLIRELVEKDSYLVVDQSIVPDDQKTIEEALIRLADQVKVDLILTTGGTGLFRPGCDAGGHNGRRRAECSWHRGSHPGLFRHDHAEGDAEPGRLGDPGPDPDRQPSGQSKSRPGESGFRPAEPLSRAGRFERRSDRLWIEGPSSAPVKHATKKKNPFADNKVRRVHIMKKRQIAAVLAGIMAMSLAVPAMAADETEGEEVKLLIAAAASLEYSMEEKLIPLFEEQNPGVKVEGSYDSSGKLQTQIEEGMEADLFFSAATKQMDVLTEEGYMKEDSEADLLENKIVAIVPKDSTLELNSFEDLANAETVALGDPDSVPAGQYAKEALTSLNLWDEVSGKGKLWNQRNRGAELGSRGKR